MLPISVAGMVTKSQGEGAILGVGRAIQKRWQSSLLHSLQQRSFNRQ